MWQISQFFFYCTKKRYTFDFSKLNKNKIAMKNYQLFYLLFFIFLFELVSCRSAQDTARLKMINNNSYCQNSSSVFYFDSLWLESIKQDTLLNSAATERFSPRARNIAKDMGIASLLNQYSEIEKTKGLDKDILAGKIAVFTHHADLEVTSCVAELNCELKRSEELRDFLRGRIQKRINRLTIASILIGTATSVIVNTVALDNARAAKYSQSFKYAFIGSSVVGSTLSIRSFFLNDKALFVHKRNALTDIWENPKQPRILPPIVWRFVNKKFPTKQGVWTSGREILIEQWKGMGMLTDSPEPKIMARNKSLLGREGYYDMGLIETRIAMLKMLTEEINLMLYDLKRLQQELILPNNR